MISPVSPPADRRVSHGPWERATDIAPVLRASGVDSSPILHYAMRRKVYETWWEGGQKMGRWDWEYAA